MDDKLKKRLRDRQKEGALRSLDVHNLSVDFFSNDYLGFSKTEFKEEVTHQGSTGSRLLSGNSTEAEECESVLADFFASEVALVYNSGYDANIGLLSCILQREDCVFYDEYIHASARDGIRLGFAKSVSFSHNDCNDLEGKLKKAEGSKYIVVESLYSMDGDMAPLKGIVELAEKYGARLIVDEAHSCGVFGHKGRGIVHARDLQSRVFGRIVTFGKAYGFHGAAVLCSGELKEYLINFSRSFVYTTALPLDSYRSIAHRISSELVRERQIQLHENIAYFRAKTTEVAFLSEENSPIQVIEYTDRPALDKIMDHLHKNGIYSKAILPPTSPRGSYRARLCIHSFNSKKEIDLLSSCLI